MSDLIDEHDFIGVYPQGYVDLMFRIEEHGISIEDSTADDVVFVENFRKIKSISPDTNMRFALGSSNGSALVHFLMGNFKEKIFTGVGTSVSGLIKDDGSGNQTVTIEASGNTYTIQQHHHIQLIAMFQRVMILLFHIAVEILK